MRVTVLRTFSTSCPPIYEPLRGLGHELTPIVYDLMNVHSPGDNAAHRAALVAEGCTVIGSAGDLEALPTLIERTGPDWVLMIGCCDAGGAVMPSPALLAAIGRRWPFVHLCCDGSERDWWPQLQRYHDAGCFQLQINIDGVKVGPIGDFGMTALCPIDMTGFPDPPRPWAERPHRLGFCGSYQLEDAYGPMTTIHPRTTAIEGIIRAGLLTVRARDHKDPSPLGYRDFLSSCRCVWNHAATGSGERMHVKARVLETALAGAVLLDNGAPTADWFRPDVDYLTYISTDNVRDILAWVDSHPAEAERMAERLRRKVIAEHSPAAFWTRAFDRLAQRNALAAAVPAGTA